MDILLLSDIHGHYETLRGILEDSGPVSLVLLSGDITNGGPAAEAATVIDEIRKLCGGAGIAAVPGNCDGPEARAYLESEGISADGRILVTHSVMVAGAGGGLGMDHAGFFGRTEEELDRTFNRAFRDFDGRAAAGLPLVALSHTPPGDTGADLRNHRHTGSKKLRSQMEERQPLVWACGHIHESRCVSLVHSTTVVNPGPAADGFYALLSMARDSAGSWSVGARLGKV